jgi:hypothetical protein
MAQKMKDIQLRKVVDVACLDGLFLRDSLQLYFQVIHFTL